MSNKNNESATSVCCNKKNNRNKDHKFNNMIMTVIMIIDNINL